MDVLLFIVIVFAVGALLYYRLNLQLSTAIVAVLLAFWTYTGLSGAVSLFFWWVAFLAVAVPLNTFPLRRRLVSNHVLTLFRRLMPPISQTEREALEAGTIWWEGGLFEGKPDWKKLHSFPKSTLTDEEKAFLDGPVEELCRMLDDWEIRTKLYDLPPQIWDYLKEKRFLGMIIPKEYGGLDFSAYAHSQVIMKIASRSTTAAVTTMVPNSLGPAELIMHYGTKEQKEYYLPRLADGREIPCFALTSSQAGSDAASMQDRGIVQKGTFEGKEVIGIKLNFDKRYITLAPTSSVIGLAFRLFDPDHLLGQEEDIGITVALVPSRLPGVETGKRHDPAGIPFLNGPVRGQDVFIPVDFIVGGAEGAGHGWRMLMERLAVGRALSLPALSVAAAKLASRATGGYARIRKQFNLPIGRFEGVEEALARIAGNTYLMDACRKMTLTAVDSGQRPALVSAMSKYNLTELMRNLVNDAMDIQGGGAIVMGPRNFMGPVYQGVPVSITVEGANILTRTLIVFGQGIIRAHPYVLKEMEAAFEPDRKKSRQRFDKALFGHIGFTLSSAIRAGLSSLTCGKLLPAPSGTPLKKYYLRLGRMSAAFAFASDVALLTLAGDLKRKEKLSGRFADVLSQLFLASAALKRFEDDGRPPSDLPLVEWSCEEALFIAQNRLSGIIDNHPNPIVSFFLRLTLFPFGKSFKAPGDKLGHKVASILLEPSETRDRLTEGIYISKDVNEPIGRIEDALEKVIAAEPLEKRIGKAVKDGLVKSFVYEDRIEEAFNAGIITVQEKNTVLKAHLARLEVITVDEFPKDHWSGKNEK